MKTICIIMMILISCYYSEAQTWNLVWSDEFTTDTINPANWTYDTGGSGWGNNELEYYTSRPENAKILNGNLLIIANKESYNSRNYTSARLKTQGLRNFQYGKIEARIKLPTGQGIWPAFWMLGQNISQVGWPKCGEIDILEHINTENKIYGTMHWDNNGHVQYGGNAPCDMSFYHTYAIEWDASAIRWFLDGTQYWQGSIANNINSTDEFHLPFFIILNLAVGGNWPHDPDATTSFPDTMYVDYVRVYQLAANGVEDGRTLGSNHFSLLQNYPNPFNPTTTIRYDIPNVGTQHVVSLRVYDLLGQEVATLFEGIRQPGNYEILFDGRELASGIYVYRLSASNSSINSGQVFEETKKFIHLK